MDWLSMLGGLIVGGIAIGSFLYRKIRIIMKLVEDLMSFKRKIEKLVASYKKAFEDEVITPDEVQDFIKQLEDILEMINEIVEDYEEIVNEEGGDVGADSERGSE